MSGSIVVEVPFKTGSVFLDLGTGEQLSAVPDGVVVVRGDDDRGFLGALLAQHGEREVSIALASAAKFLAAYTAVMELVVRRLPLSTEL